MTSEQRELLRVGLLRLVDAADAERGITESYLLESINLMGSVRLTLAEMRDELAYLKDKQFITAAARQLSPENRRWVKTASGRDFLAELDR